jgi:radical SAM/Cys-rich protein
MRIRRKMKPQEQLKMLSQDQESFDHVVSSSLHEQSSLKPLSLRTFQVNMGKKCNQACRHCHVDASPKRTEMMARKTVDLCLQVIAEVKEIDTVDITGGAPEMNDHFTYFVQACKKLGKHVIDRCNLTILEETGYEYLYDFLREHEVEVVASLPHFRRTYTNRQRGSGVFEKSIKALKALNKLGYGQKYPLNLVYNPAGAFLSSSQHQLEREFKENLKNAYDIEFNNLYCINNMPINRYLQALIKVNKFDEYIGILKNAFNPSTLEGLMCRHQISISYTGHMYDCDFNQMLGFSPIGHIRDFDYDTIMSRNIQTANHCFGCTAGAGSSCGGEIAN